MAIKPKKQMPANKGETGGGMLRGGTSSKLPSKLVDQLKADIKAQQAAKAATAKKAEKAKRLKETAAGAEKAIKAIQKRPATNGAATADAARKAAAKANTAKFSNKQTKKLDQLDRRSKAVAPGKKYSDMTPAEKRKWDSLNAEATTRMTKKKGM